MVRGWWSAIVLSFWWSILSKSPQQIFSANLLSRFSQQIFSASSQQIFSADHLLWSGVGGQLLSYHLPCHLLWSGVGGQLLSYHFGGLYCMSSLEGPFRGAFGKNVQWIKVVTNDSIGTCSSESYSFSLLKLPPPPRAAICYTAPNLSGGKLFETSATYCGLRCITFCQSERLLQYFTITQQVYCILHWLPWNKQAVNSSNTSYRSTTFHTL